MRIVYLRPLGLLVCLCLGGLGLVGPLPAQALYTVTDLGLYGAQDIYGPTTNAAGWEVSTYSSGFPLNSYSLVHRPGDAGFSPLFPDAYLFMDAAYGINDKNMVVGATNLFYSINYAYRADGNLHDILNLNGVTDMGGTDITNIEKATRILDNGTIIGLGRTSSDTFHVVQLNPIAPELYWDSNGTTAGVPQGGGLWSHGAALWTNNTAGTSVAGWTDGAIAKFGYNTSPSAVTVADIIQLEGIWAGYTPNGMTIDATGGGALTFTGQGFIRLSGSSNSLVISAPIAGNAGLHIFNNGDLILEGDNTYTGQTTITDYTDVYVRHENSLGASGTGNETIVSGNGRVRIDRSLTLQESFVLNGGAIYLQSDYSGVDARNVTLAGSIVLTQQGLIGGSNPSYNSNLTVSGVISESGGPQNIEISGATLAGANTFTGDLITYSHGVTVSQVTDAGVAGQMGQGSRLLIGRNFEGPEQGEFHYTGATASTNRTVFLEGGGAIDVVNPAATLTLSGLIDGPRGLGKTGAGTLLITGANTFVGGTQVSEGTLRIANTTGSALGPGVVVVDAGATLTGSGSFTGNLNLSGDYVLGDTGTPATLTMVGNLTLNSDGWLSFDVGGPTRGTQYDALDIGGLFSSEGSIRLTLTDGFMPTLGDSFNLLDWGTPGSISFLNFDATALGSGLYWDVSLLASMGAVSVTDVAPAAVPEPGTYALLAGTVALGLVMWRRRRITS